MPVTSIESDSDALTTTVIADFPVPLSRLWGAYADPRKLERFWGPPTYPAQFFRHDFAKGGRSSYTMTGPEGDQHSGYLEWVEITPKSGFEVLDGFANPDGTPNTQMPNMRMFFEFTSTTEGARMSTTTHFPSLQAMEQLIEMGAIEGTREAMGQMDEVLADLRTFASDLPAHAQILSDTQVRVSRVLNGSAEDVWRAHTEADLMRQWLLGPDGWTMPVCQIAAVVGDGYRYEWESIDGRERFGFEGELLESFPPFRQVTSERMIGMPGDGTVNEMTLTQTADGTLLSLLITYPDVGLRDTILATGMTDGMETSYQRLESMLS